MQENLCSTRNKNEWYKMSVSHHPLPLRAGIQYNRKWMWEAAIGRSVLPKKNFTAAKKYKRLEFVSAIRIMASGLAGMVAASGIYLLNNTGLKKP